MKCKIIDAGFQSRNPWHDYNNLYVIVKTYKPRIFFWGYKLFSKDRVILVKNISKDVCLGASLKYLESHTSQQVIADIIKDIKRQYGISEMDCMINDAVDKVNKDIKSLIGLEFEI